MCELVELQALVLRKKYYANNDCCFSFVLEGVPKVVDQTITEKVSIPTIGIGALVKAHTTIT